MHLIMLYLCTLIALCSSVRTRHYVIVVVQFLLIPESRVNDATDTCTLNLICIWPVSASRYY